MSHSKSDRPPPLPPRSPRPPSTTHIRSQQPVLAYPPPPTGPPPQTPAVSPNLGGPPPPIPPRPPGYEIRNPRSPATAPAHTPSSIYASLSPIGQVNPSFPLPPPPPGPPPPRIALEIDTSPPAYDNPQSGYLTSPHSAHKFPSPQTHRLPSPIAWTNIPPPPPGPPPQGSSSLNLHLSPGFTQNSPTPARPLSPAGAPTGLPSSQSFPGHSQHQSKSPSIGETHNSSFKNLACPSGKSYTYQSPVTALGASNSLPLAYSLLPENPQSASTPLSGASSVQTASIDAQHFKGILDISSSSVSPSTHKSELESPFQSLHLTSTPPIPPKTPLPPQTTQTHSAKSASSPPGAIPVYHHSAYQAQACPPYESSRKASIPVFEAQQTPVNPPVPRQNPVSPAWSAPLRGSTLRAVTACIEIPMSFSTDWYWHLEASEFFICSRCYVDHIYAKRFQDEFQSARFTDGKPRVCRFGKPRMKDYIYVEALKSGSLRLAIEWMRLRPTITDCKGLDGVKGKFAMGIQWYKARENDIPGFISCQACYEDIVMTNQFAQNFELSLQPQPIDAVWACDMAIPFIENEYEKKGKLNDWQSFASEAQDRITAERCPGGTRIVTYGKNWFVPKARTPGLILCATCYCDHVIHSGEEDKWEIAPELSRSGDHKARCAQGMFNIRILFAEARTKKDFALLWNGINKLNREKTCEAEGITDGVWYTFPSNPSEFGVCAACYAGILEPLGVSRFWVGKHDVSPGAKMLCCFNLSHPRFKGFLPRLFEMYLALDPTALHEYASMYAAIPLCLRDKDTTNRRWYGWNECTICSECYLDFARHSSLVELMELRDMPLAGSTLCDMYSPRMRALYTECASVSPPDLKRLLEYSVQRQVVYNETMPTVRMILNQQLMALKRQQILNTTSAYYSMAGQLHETMFGNSRTYSAVGIGSGFANMQSLQAAAYGKQAMEVGAGVGGQMMIVHQLEQRWRAVE